MKTFCKKNNFLPKGLPSGFRSFSSDNFGGGVNLKLQSSSFHHEQKSHLDAKNKNSLLPNTLNTSVRPISGMSRYTDTGNTLKEHVPPKMT